MSVHLEILVRQWRDAILAIDRMSAEERRKDMEPLHRLMAAHKALFEYAKEMG